MGIVLGFQEEETLLPVERVVASENHVHGPQSGILVVLTIRYASGAIAISAAFGAGWLTVLHMAGVQLAGRSAMSAVSILSPAMLPLTIRLLAPWSYSRVRHT